MKKKLKFFFGISFFPLKRMLNFFGIKYNVMDIINDYYKEDFKKISPKDVAVMMPHCLISDKCPARFSKQDGILCTNCGLCRCGEIKELSRKKGYQFYITPSVGFTKRLAERKEIKGLIGAACDYEIKRLVTKERLSSKGGHLKDSTVIPQGIYILNYNCIKNEVDWDKLKSLIENG